MIVSIPFSCAHGLFWERQQQLLEGFTASLESPPIKSSLHVHSLTKLVCSRCAEKELGQLSEERDGSPHGEQEFADADEAPHAKLDSVLP